MPSGLAGPVLPDVAASDVLLLVVGGLGITAVAFAEAVGPARSAAAATALVALFLTDTLTNLPEPTLGAIVIVRGGERHDEGHRDAAAPAPQHA